MVDLDEKKIYPTLHEVKEQPTAPPLVDEGHTYRLKVITNVQKYLEEEIQKRDTFSKKYFRVAKVVNITDNILIGVTICVEGGGAIALSTGVGAPVALILGISGAVTGAISLFGNYIVKKTTTKAEKHLKIKTIADAKLNTINSHISKAMLDNYISDGEFKLIMEELNKYKAMKVDIKSKNKKKINTDEEESLIERGRREARETFRRLVEKHGTI